MRNEPGHSNVGHKPNANSRSPSTSPSSSPSNSNRLFFFGQANTTRPNGEMCAVNARNMMINGRQLAVTFVQLLLSEKEFWGGARGQFPNGSTDTSSRYNIYRLFKGKRPMTATYIDKKMSIICIESIILILTATYIDKKSILCIESKI